MRGGGAACAHRGEARWRQRGTARAPIACTPPLPTAACLPPARTRLPQRAAGRVHGHRAAGLREGTVGCGGWGWVCLPLLACCSPDRALAAQLHLPASQGVRWGLRCAPPTCTRLAARPVNAATRVGARAACIVAGEKVRCDSLGDGDEGHRGGGSGHRGGMGWGCRLTRAGGSGRKGECEHVQGGGGAGRACTVHPHGAPHCSGTSACGGGPQAGDLGRHAMSARACAAYRAAEPALLDRLRAREAARGAGRRLELGGGGKRGGASWQRRHRREAATALFSSYGGGWGGCIGGRQKRKGRRVVGWRACGRAGDVSPRAWRLTLPHHASCCSRLCRLVHAASHRQSVRGGARQAPRGRQATAAAAGAAVGGSAEQQQHIHSAGGGRGGGARTGGDGERVGRGGAQG